MEGDGLSTDLTLHQAFSGTMVPHPGLRSSSGSFAIFAAIRRASPGVSSLAADRALAGALPGPQRAADDECPCGGRGGNEHPTPPIAFQRQQATNDHHHAGAGAEHSTPSAHIDLDHATFEIEGLKVALGSGYGGTKEPGGLGRTVLLQPAQVLAAPHFINMRDIAWRLRVRPETSGRIAEFSEHEAD